MQCDEVVQGLLAGRALTIWRCDLDGVVGQQEVKDNRIDTYSGGAGPILLWWSASALDQVFCKFVQYAHTMTVGAYYMVKQV